MTVRSDTPRAGQNRPKWWSSGQSEAHLGDQESKVKLGLKSWGGGLLNEPRLRVWTQLIIFQWAYEIGSLGQMQGRTGPKGVTWSQISKGKWAPIWKFLFDLKSQAIKVLKTTKIMFYHPLINPISTFEFLTITVYANIWLLKILEHLWLLWDSNDPKWLQMLC